MTDEEAVRRGQETARAMQVVGPVLDTMIAKATTELLAASPDVVLQRQLYARALADVKRTLEGHIKAGEFAATLNA